MTSSTWYGEFLRQEVGRRDCVRTFCRKSYECFSQERYIAHWQGQDDVQNLLSAALQYTEWTGES